MCVCGGGRYLSENTGPRILFPATVGQAKERSRFKRPIPSHTGAARAGQKDCPGVTFGFLAHSSRVRRRERPSLFFPGSLMSARKARPGPSYGLAGRCRLGVVEQKTPTRLPLKTLLAPGAKPRVCYSASKPGCAQRGLLLRKPYRDLQPWRGQARVKGAGGQKSRVLQVRSRSPKRVTGPRRESNEERPKGGQRGTSVPPSSAKPSPKPPASSLTQQNSRQ